MDEEILDIENLDAPEKTEEQKKREEERKDQPARIIPSSLFLNPEALKEINEKALDASKYLTGERLITRIKERVTNVPEKDLTKIEEVGPFEGFAAGIIDGSIKLPYGFVTLAAEIKDALGEDGIPVEESNVAKLQEYFDNTVLGKIQKGAEETVRESAIGRLTSAFTQLYGTGRIAASGTIKAMEKANEVYNKYSKAAKLNKVVKANPNAVKAGIKAKELNKLSGKQKFLGVTLGGGLGTGLVVDIEGIGTWGDVLGGPTQLDKEPLKEADDDAVRKLWNRLKFGSEAAVTSVPIVYGVNYFAKRISESGKYLKYSDDELDRLIDKYIVKPFAPRGGKPQKVFEGLKRVEGKISAGTVSATDLIRDIDQTLYKIAKTSGISNRNPAWKRLIGRLDELLTSTDDVIKAGKVKFTGFSDEKLKEFRKFTKEIGLNSDETTKLINEMGMVRNEFNNFKNILLSGGNLNVANGEFMKIMSDRMRNIFNSEYKIFEGKSILPWRNYKPTDSAINDVQQVFKKFAKEKGVELGPDDLDAIINDVIENVRINPATKTPEFPLSTFTALDDETVQLINIADSLKGGQFKPTNLIKSKQDLRAFQRFFGQKRDLRNTIVNTMADLSTLVAKDEFYSNLIKQSDDLVKNGERSVLYPTRQEAVVKMPYQKIIADKRGLNIKSPLGEQVYTNPVNGYFTSQEMADALNFSEKLLFDGLAKDAAYQTLFLIPKGLTQISKTILGPFTHTRNFITASQFALGTGNLFKDPRKIVSNFKQAFNTIQPQLLYRNTPKDQQLYKFLLEEQVTSSSASARDIAGLLDDIGKGGDVYMRLFGRFGKAMKKIYNVAGDIYVAEDDIWKIVGYETQLLQRGNAYKKAGIKISDDALKKEVATIVQDTIPNYAKVGEFVRAARMSPFGNFMSWPSEVFRTGTGIFRQIIKDLKDPITGKINPITSKNPMKGLAMKRLIGTTLTMAAIPYGLIKGSQALFGVSNEEADAANDFVAPWAQDSQKIYMRDPETDELYYINWSQNNVYDTLTRPFQTVLRNIQEGIEDEDVLLKGFVQGIAQAAGQSASPFISESIYTEAFMDIYSREGRTREGRQLFNDQTPDPERIAIIMQHLGKTLLPTTAPFERTIKGFTGEPGKGSELYEIPKELAGIFGFRPIKVDPEKSLGFKLFEYQKAISDSRGLFTGEIDPTKMKTAQDVIERYFIANKQTFEARKKMLRSINNAKELGIAPDKVESIFDKRGLKSEYEELTFGIFDPFYPSKKIRERFQDLAQKGNIADVFVEAEPIIAAMNAAMESLTLFDEFNLELSDFLPDSDPEGQSALPPTVMPNAQVIQSAAMQQVGAPGTMNQGLTPTENALLSDEEKQIKLRSRGLA